MMRALAERHSGLLPLDTVESIWRVIIATFTYVQAPYAVHADISGATRPMRDSARFHFGFTVPYLAHRERGGGDRGGGVLPRRSRHLPARPGRLSRRLVAHARGTGGRPKVIARLPFIERPGPSGRHPGLRDLEAAGRCGRPRRGALRGPVRALAGGRQRGAARLGGEVVASAGRPTGSRSSSPCRAPSPPARAREAR